MRRYKFLTKSDVYDALSKLRASFLAAKDGEEVEEIIKAILTHDERIKIGRRIMIAQLLQDGYTFDSIRKLLKVGKNTVAQIEKKFSSSPLGFKLINKKEAKVEYEFKQKAYKKTGGSKLVFKKKKYNGFSRKDVKR